MEIKTFKPLPLFTGIIFLRSGEERLCTCSFQWRVAPLAQGTGQLSFL
jgi:hypothetical protein